MNSTSFQLHVITDDKLDLETLLTVVQESASGADSIQFRSKTRSALEMYQAAQQLKTAIGSNTAQFVMNDRIDLALALDVNRVHLGGSSLPIEAARKILGPNAVIGRSVHSLEEAQQAERSGASYITFGHIFESQSKPGIPPRGLALLQEIVDQASIPVIAIGGINESNLDQVLQTGASGVAVIGSVMRSPNPGAAVMRLREKMSLCPYSPKYPWIR